MMNLTKRVTKIITVYDDGTTDIQDFYTAPMPQPSVPYYDIKNKCPKCGLVCEGAMGYCCPSNPCPMGMGGVTC
jgi:hypothetical protein